MCSCALPGFLCILEMNFVVKLNNKMLIVYPPEVGAVENPDKIREFF